MVKVSFSTERKIRVGSCMYMLIFHFKVHDNGGYYEKCILFGLISNSGTNNVIIVITPKLQSQVVEMEGEVTCLNSLLRQKEREVEQVSQVATKLTSERDNVADVVRQEFADRSV